MRSKQTISEKLDRLESELRKLNYTIGIHDRDTSYVYLDAAKALISDINTLLNREVQD